MYVLVHVLNKPILLHVLHRLPLNTNEGIKQGTKLKAVEILNTRTTVRLRLTVTKVGSRKVSVKERK